VGGHEREVVGVGDRVAVHEEAFHVHGRGRRARWQHRDELGRADRETLAGGGNATEEQGQDDR
jgi:hypothetical protein